MTVSKLAGVKPSDIGLEVLRGSARPILPNTRDKTLVIPGRNGLWDFGADLEPRYFNLECAFLTRSPLELQTHAETLAGILVDGRGKPKTFELVFSVHPERVYYVRYSGSLGIDRLVGFGRFTLPLVAYDPFAYGAEQIIETTFTANNYASNITSNSNIETPPVITLSNEGGNTISGFTITSEILVQ